MNGTDPALCKGQWPQQTLIVLEEVCYCEVFTNFQTFGSAGHGSPKIARHVSLF
jgi:hypothetical protein